MTRQVTNEDGSITLLDTYAKIVDDIVFQIIESELDPDGINGQWVACPDNVGPGFTVNAERTVWTAPVLVEPRAIVVPKLEYLKLFTQAERIAIRALGRTNDFVNDYIELMNAAVTVNLDAGETVQGLADLETAGAIAVGRAAEIRGL